VAGCLAIQTCTEDNTYLPQDYVEDLRTLTGVRYKRFFLGLWVGAEGLVFDTFDADIHEQIRSNVLWSETIVAVDDGYSNPFAAGLLHADGDGRVHMESLIYQNKLVNATKVQLVKEMCGEKPILDEENKPTGQFETRWPSAVVVDPSAAELKQEFRNAGFHVIDADNSVIDGISRVQQRLEVQGDGKPRYTQDPICIEASREFGTYEFREGKDIPVKENDHAMDMIRYGISYFDQPRGGNVFFV
jgi:phage terminase large subunit